MTRLHSRSVLTLDNRGVGKSSCPRPKAAYRTTIMAQDVLALMVRQCCLYSLLALLRHVPP